MPRPRTPGAETVRTTLVLPVALWQRAKVRALEERRDLREVLLEALGRYLGEPVGVPTKEEAR